MSECTCTGAPGKRSRRGRVRRLGAFGVAGPMSHTAAAVASAPCFRTAARSWPSREVPRRVVRDFPPAGDMAGHRPFRAGRGSCPWRDGPGASAWRLARPRPLRTPRRGRGQRLRHGAPHPCSSTPAGRRWPRRHPLQLMRDGVVKHRLLDTVVGTVGGLVVAVLGDKGAATATLVPGGRAKAGRCPAGWTWAARMTSRQGLRRAPASGLCGTCGQGSS